MVTESDALVFYSVSTQYLAERAISSNLGKAKKGSYFKLLLAYFTDKY